MSAHLLRAPAALPRRTGGIGMLHSGGRCLGDRDFNSAVCGRGSAEHGRKRLLLRRRFLLAPLPPNLLSDRS